MLFNGCVSSVLNSMFVSFIVHGWRCYLYIVHTLAVIIQYNNKEITLRRNSLLITHYSLPSIFFRAITTEGVYSLINIIRVDGFVVEWSDLEKKQTYSNQVHDRKYINSS